MQQFVKFVRPVLIRNHTALYGLPLDLCGKRGIRYCGAFRQTRRNSAKRGAFSREKRHNPSVQFLQCRCGALQDGALSGIASKCGAHGGDKPTIIRNVQTASSPAPRIRCPNMEPTPRQKYDQAGGYTKICIENVL